MIVTSDAELTQHFGLILKGVTKLTGLSERKWCDK